MNTSRHNRRFTLRPTPLMGAIIAAIVLALLLIAYNLFRPVPMVGSKSIAVEVIYEDGTIQQYSLTTEAQYLQEAVEQTPGLTLNGTTSEEYGLMIDEINGHRADYQKDGAYWAILCDGEPCNYGVSMQPIKNGESYSFVYTKAGEDFSS